jgi:hypothetical protein
VDDCCRVGARRLHAARPVPHRALIPSHDAIWDVRVQSFIGHLILVSGQSSDLNERIELRRRALNAK